MTRRFFSALIVVLVTGCAGIQGIAPGPQSVTANARAGDPLVARLVEGGYVLYMRHGKTESEPTFQDKQDRPNWWKSCDTRVHRPLSDEGRAQMMNIGRQIRELGIPVAKVVTSEYCRAVDSGLLLQLMPIAQDAALNYVYAQRYVKRSDSQIAAGLRALFSAPPPAGRNVILIGHVHGFDPLLDPLFARMQEADTIVMKPAGGGRFEIVGRIPADKWALRQQK